MEYILSLIFGIVQGVTEFFPVSSSGHLLLMHEFFDFNLVDNLAFDVALHLGTLLALLVFFCSDISRLLSSFFTKKNENIKEDRQLVWFILIGILPAGLVGYFYQDFIENFLHQSWIVVIMLIVVGLLFLFVERTGRKGVNLDNLSLSQVIGIGLAQVLALIPGTSRSGITIVTAIALGVRRKAAARYSFLMAIPLILGASLTKAYDLYSAGINWSQGVVFLLGIMSAAVFGYLAIKFLMRFVENNRLNVFAYYRFVLAIIITIYFYIL